MALEQRKITPRERVEKEIRLHPRWCTDKCTTFNPSKYRKARLELGLSHQELLTGKTHGI